MPNALRSLGGDPAAGEFLANIEDGVDHIGDVLIRH